MQGITNASVLDEVMFAWQLDTRLRNEGALLSRPGQDVGFHKRTTAA